jgi:hypothetical protein
MSQIVALSVRRWPDRQDTEKFAPHLLLLLVSHFTSVKFVIKHFVSLRFLENVTLSIKGHSHEIMFY